MAGLEMDKDATFKQMYEGYDLDKACLTQGQILEFIKSHKDKLRDGGYSTFFLFKVAKGDKSEFFVARVYVYDDGTLSAYVRRFSYGLVWDAGRRHRVVVPATSLLESKSNDSLNLSDFVTRKEFEELIAKLNKILKL